MSAILEPDTISKINRVACYLNLSIFALFLVVESYVMCKIKKTVDRSALVTLVVYTISLLCRVYNWIIYLINGMVPENEAKGNAAIITIDLIASIMIWLVLYYFVFEMRIVKDKLES